LATGGGGGRGEAYPKRKKKGNTYQRQGKVPQFPPTRGKYHKALPRRLGGKESTVGGNQEKKGRYLVAIWGGRKREG